MKKLNLGLIISAMLLTASLLYLNSCKKQSSTEASDVVGLDDGSTEVIKHILDFKKEMEYYRNNPGIKSSGTTYSADSAALELESLINFNFCYTDVNCIKKTYTTSEVIMPLDLLNRINDPHLMQVYFDKVIDTIQAQMRRVNYINMKLLLVDLEVTAYNGNGDAVISIRSMIGKQGTVSTTEQGWWFGKDAGTCQGNLPGEDATDQITANINNIKLPVPPPDKIRRKSNIITLPKLEPEDWIFDENNMDNYKDSRLFYANAIYGTITDDTRCLTGYIDNDSEMTFYSDSYLQFINDAEEDNDLEYTECVIEWAETINNNTGIQTKIKHELTITLGNVWLIDQDSIVIEDILTY